MTTPTIEQIDAAIRTFDSGYEGDPDFLEFSSGDTIRFALRFLRVMMDEPREEMKDYGWECAFVKRLSEPVHTASFKAMRDKALEIAGRE